MQGSYKNNGLPRPYYMKPSKRGSVYDKMPKQVFLTNSRKLTGYLVMLFLFGLCVFLVSQELRTPAESNYELVGSTGNAGNAGNAGKGVEKNSGDVGKLVDSAKDSVLENDKADLAMNKAQNSKGEYGHAVMEAPKGGMVNEAHVVGTDEDLVLDGKTKKTNQENAPPGRGKGFKAAREDEAKENQAASVGKPKAKANTGESGAKIAGEQETPKDLGGLNKPTKKLDDMKEIPDERKQKQ